MCLEPASSATISRERVMQRGKVSRDRVTSTSVLQKFLINENSFDRSFSSKTASHFVEPYQPHLLRDKFDRMRNILRMNVSRSA
jgi:hypothetical protein